MKKNEHKKNKPHYPRMCGKRAEEKDRWMRQRKEYVQDATQPEIIQKRTYKYSNGFVIRAGSEESEKTALNTRMFIFRRKHEMVHLIWVI